MYDSALSRKFIWQAKWIGVPGVCLINWKCEVLPAPFFRRIFFCAHKTHNARIYICGLGYYELYLNGRRVGEHVLDPVVTHYDKRVRYVVYDVSEYLVAGNNAIGAILGNGWYNCHTPASWHFDKASWRDYPKLMVQMEGDAQTLLVSDETWKVSSGPIVFDGLRNGETYDARLELDDWTNPDYDDSSWAHVVRVNPPGGILQEQTMPPCKVMKTILPVREWSIASIRVYDLGQNMTGWIRITVRGDAGTKLTIKYGERLNSDHCVEQKDISIYVLSTDNFQTDRYILKGIGNEIWEPRFTYHGFQYVQINITGNAHVKTVEGRVVHTAFERIGYFNCSDDTINRLQECNVWSYINNFTGIPTDCPHREKNGWTGDAQLAAETGLFNFAAAESYEQWLDSIADAQRPSGQLPGIVPSCGWGYNWGSGPAWDSAFILIPWYIYIYTGNNTSIIKHYDAMKKYVDYCTSMSDKNILSFGLGDWGHVDETRIVEPALTSTAYYYVDCLLLAKFATITEHWDDQKHYTRMAIEIKKAFNQRFYKGGGIYAKGEQTGIACALYQGLAEDSEKVQIAQKLAEAVNVNGGKPDFGILGAKYVPRALAENGYVESAYRMITQSEFPGWVHWLKQGATTFWESWKGINSRNQIMFGDISAWMYQYLVGISPDPEMPGFKHIIIHPHPISGLDWVKSEYDSPYGKIKVAWQKEINDFKLEIQIPDSTTATIRLPDFTTKTVVPGEYQFNVRLNCKKTVDNLCL